MTVRRDQPYLYPTWLAKLMSGEISCEWAVWYRVHYKDWARPPSDFDEARYTMEHTRLLREMRSKRDPGTERIYVERQGSFWYTHPSGIRISGTPDLVTTGPNGNCVYEAKAFSQRPYHKIQTMIYMYCLPRSERMEFFGRTFSGEVQYVEHAAQIASEEVAGRFEEQLNYWMTLLSSNDPMERFPSEQECRFCNIGKVDCPDRMAEVTVETED